MPSADAPAWWGVFSALIALGLGLRLFLDYVTKKRGEPEKEQEIRRVFHSHVVYHHHKRHIL
jgi:hypothetical protein